jgi:hypothetical protein
LSYASVPLKYLEQFEEGRHLGAIEIASILLRRRFGPVPAEVESSVQSLRIDQLELLCDLICDKRSLNELMDWLKHFPQAVW